MKDPNLEEHHLPPRQPHPILCNGALGAGGKGLRSWEALRSVKTTLFRKCQNYTGLMVARWSMHFVL